MNIRVIVPIFLLALLGSADRLQAATALEARIDIDLQDANPADVFRLFASVIGTEFTVDENITANVTIFLKNVSVRTAMTAVGESVGCTWRFSDGKLVFTAIPGAANRPRAPRGGSGGPAQPSDTEARLEPLLSAPLTLDLNDAPIENTFQLMAEIFGGTLEMDESLRGKMITIESTGHPTRDLLDRLCQMAECRWELVPGAVPILRIRKQASTGPCL